MWQFFKINANEFGEIRSQGSKYRPHMFSRFPSFQVFFILLAICTIAGKNSRVHSNMRKRQQNIEWNTTPPNTAYSTPCISGIRFHRLSYMADITPPNMFTCCDNISRFLYIYLITIPSDVIKVHRVLKENTQFTQPFKKSPAFTKM
jgi:hypothetical protein